MVTKSHTRSRAESVPRTLREKLDAGQFVIATEVDPPHGLNPERVIRGAKLLRDSGVDCLNVGDNPTAKVRMSALCMSIILEQQVGIETIMHYSTRDRNSMAIHSDMIGAHILGIRNVLCVRGDPPALGGYKDVIGVWDVSAVGLIRILNLLNKGMDWTGQPIGDGADFFIGAAANLNADPLEPELRLMRRKVEAGADFFMTQNIFDETLLNRFLEKTSRFGRPIIVGILPLYNYRHAEFLNSEVPGIVIPEAMRERMRRASDNGPAEGRAMARDMIKACRDQAAGVYIVPSFSRFEPIAELVSEVK